MLKKRQVTNRLQATSGGWVAIRQVQYEGIGTAFGLPYHQVAPIVSSGEWNEMTEWCVNTYGPSGTTDMPGVWTPYERWYANNAKFWFKDIKDCEWFLLRWQ